MKRRSFQSWLRRPQLAAMRSGWTHIPTGFSRGGVAARATCRVLRDGLVLVTGPTLDGEAWGFAPYQPTPTIIEAARALYSRHTVEAISRNDAGAQNLG